MKTNKTEQMKPRNIYTLLCILLAYMNFFEDGLCKTVLLLEGKGIITNNEHDVLVKYITSYKWFRIYWWISLFGDQRDYMFPAGKKEPRLRWLRRHIWWNKPETQIKVLAIAFLCFIPLISVTLLLIF